VWSLKANTKDAYDSLLVLSFVNQTSFLTCMEDALDGTDIAGAVSDLPTLYFGLTATNKVTRS
jgi:hypothetical protein